MTTATKLPSPAEMLGLELCKFQSWYPSQDTVVARVLDWLGDKDAKRILALSLPTGSGKSLTAVVSAHVAEKRAVLLTSTKALQAQYQGDFNSLGIADIRGQNSYSCRVESTHPLTAEEGPCHDGLSCQYKGMGCPYYDRLREAIRAPLVVTNYAYYFAQMQYSEQGLGDIGLLVCDEGHLAHTALESHLSETVSQEEIQSMGGIFPFTAFDEWKHWKSWAETERDRVATVAGGLKKSITQMRDTGRAIPSKVLRAHRRATSLERKLTSITRSSGRWVWERWEGQSGFSWKFTPVWVRDYAYPLLFRDIPKIIIMSAMLTPKSLEVLGARDEDIEFIDAPSYFPPERNPIMHLPAVRVNYRTTPQEMQQWVTKIDQIITKRNDRRIIVFTASYARGEFLVEHSRHKEIMITHRTKNVVEQMNKFRRTPPPVVLISPAITTGVNFIYDECRVSIVGKIPYPNTDSPVMRARNEEDDEYSTWVAMDTFVQECGRNYRAPDDYGEVFVVDDSWYWFWKRYKFMAPRWFRERVVGTVRVIPDAPEIESA